MLHEYIHKTINYQNLSSEEMTKAMDIIMDGKADPVQVATLLTALKMKGETPEEVAAAAKVMLAKAQPTKTDLPCVLDIVGTGGDETNTFNISTTSSFVIAGAGVAVAKHGNRGVSSKSGAADVLEALGVNIQVTPEQNQKILEEIGIAFFFSQTYHQSMKNVGPIRAAMKEKTMFNILGPLTNPIHPNTYVIGAYDEKTADLMIHVYQELEVEHAVVFLGNDHMDEVSLTGPTTCLFLDNGEIHKEVITPEQFGLTRCELSDLVGGAKEDNAKILLDILNGKE